MSGQPRRADGPTQTWTVGPVSVLGYAAADGRFCFEFRTLTGGCLEPGVLSDERPLNVSTDFAPGTFHVYGLAMDGVAGVTVHVQGTSLPAVLAHNAFFVADDALGGMDAFPGEVVATMSDGTTRSGGAPPAVARRAVLPTLTTRLGGRHPGTAGRFAVTRRSQLCILVPRCIPQASTTANCCGVRAWTQTRSPPSTAGTRTLSTARS